MSQRCRETRHHEASAARGRCPPRAVRHLAIGGRAWPTKKAPLVQRGISGARFVPVAGGQPSGVFALALKLAGCHLGLIRHRATLRPGARPFRWFGTRQPC